MDQIKPFIVGRQTGKNIPSLLTNIGKLNTIETVVKDKTSRFEQKGEIIPEENPKFVLEFLVYDKVRYIAVIGNNGYTSDVEIFSVDGGWGEDGSFTDLTFIASGYFKNGACNHLWFYESTSLNAPGYIHLCGEGDYGRFFDFMKTIERAVATIQPKYGDVDYVVLDEESKPRIIPYTNEYINKEIIDFNLEYIKERKGEVKS